MARKKGTGALCQRGKKFYLRFRNGTNSRFIELEGARDAEQAAVIAAKYRLIAEAQNAEEVAVFVARQKNIINDAESPEIDKAFAAFSASPNRRQCGKRQLGAHESYWRDFIDSLPAGVQKINQITPRAAESYFSNTTFSARTFNARLKSCRLICKTLLPANADNPFGAIKAKPEMPKSKKEFTAEQLKKVFESVDSGYPLSVPCREEMKILFRIAAYTGMRLEDCALLQWENVKHNYIRLQPGKTLKSSGKYISIPLHPELAAILSPAQKTGDVLPEVAERYRRNPSGVDASACRVINWALEKEHHFYVERGARKPKIPDSIPGYGMHSFRHSFVSFCANAGVPIDIVRDIVGHTNTAVTRIYTHISDSARNAVLNALSLETQNEGANSELNNILDAIRHDSKFLAVVTDCWHKYKSSK